MTVHPSRYPIESPHPPPSPADPTVFVRTFTTPPGLPWDQARVALLEARSGAPLPLGEVIYQLRRLDPWFMGRAARYAAFYVRAQEGSDLQSTVEVNGRPMRVRFLSTAARNHRARSLAVLAGVTGGLALVVSAAVTTALTTRAETAGRLDAVAQIAVAKTRAAKSLERQRLMGQALDEAGVRNLSLNAALADLAWAAGARTPGARLDALHWDHGHMAVEARGDEPPFISGERTVIRADKPLRPRVWLWGVEPAHSAGSAP